MSSTKTQAKIWVEPAVLSGFKAKCATEGVSMASVIGRWMVAGQPAQAAKIKIDTRPHRRKAVAEVIRLLNGIMERESIYRDSIPEQFDQRLEAADHACGQMVEAITCPEDAF